MPLEMIVMICIYHLAPSYWQHLLFGAEFWAFSVVCLARDFMLNSIPAWPFLSLSTSVVCLLSDPGVVFILLGM